jgi:hypothetical protein
LTQPKGLSILIHQTKIESLLGGNQCLSVKVFLNVSVSGIPGGKETHQESERQRNGRDQESPVHAGW